MGRQSLTVMMSALVLILAISGAGLAGLFHFTPQDYAYGPYSGAHGYSYNVAYGYGLPFTTAAYPDPYTFPSGWGYYPYAYRAALARRAHAAHASVAPVQVEAVDLAPVPPDARCALVEVQVPAGAEIWFDGEKTRQTGTARLFWSPPLDTGKISHYELRVRWPQDGKAVEQTRTVAVAAGTRVRLVFPQTPATAPLPPLDTHARRLNAAALQPLGR